MKIQIDWMEIKTSASSGKKYIKATVTPEGGEQVENVAIFDSFPGFATLAPGHNIEGEFTVKDYNGTKSYSINAPKTQSGGRPNMDRIIEKKQQGIAEAQSTKAQNIAEAQDRTAWMWAKNNATEILASRFPQGYTQDAMVADILELATDIYNGKPVRPF